jgi:hypothetical protein
MGRRLVAWHDDRHGKFQIYAARSNALSECQTGRSRVISNLDDSFDPSDPYDPYLFDTCDLQFQFTNTTTSVQNFHFVARFYSDRERTTLVKTVSSRTNITNWFVDGEQMPFNGTNMGMGETIDVVYHAQGDDDLSNLLLYVEIDGETPLETVNNPYLYGYYCPVIETSACTIPCSYSNVSGSPTSVHFRVLVYRDEAMTELLLSADTSTDQRKWVSGEGTFPTGGITVADGESAAVYYNPEILPPEMYNQQDVESVKALLCNVTYYVKVQQNISGVYTNLDTFAFNCSCNDVIPDLWREDTDSKTWLCSGQGSNDARITDTNGHAMFANSVASNDGFAYIAWEDYRYSGNTDEQKDISPDIFFAVWDANNDKFYSSAQGSYDHRVTVYTDAEPGRYYQPQIILSGFQNPTFFFKSQTGVFKKSCSLFNDTSSETELDEPEDNGTFATEKTVLTTNDVANCSLMKVVDEDVVRLHHLDANTPIALVKDCFVNFEMTGPPGTYAVRLKNENESNWSDWLTILPELPNYPATGTYTFRGDGTVRSEFEAYYIGNDRFVVPWVLSAGTGNKTVYAEILTPSGKTPTMSLNVIARYEELKYKVEFFTDAEFETQVPTYNGYPVLSTSRLKVSSSSSSSSSSSIPISYTINPKDVSSIAREVEDVSTIYIRVTFSNIARLQKILDLQSVEKFANLNSPSTSDLSFNVIQQGINASYGLSLEQASEGVYTGSFPIVKSDGVCNKDGLAAVIVNVPDPATKVYTPEFTFDQTDKYNWTMPKVGDFQGAYSIVPQQTTTNIIDRAKAAVTSRAISAEKFKTKYNKEILCSFNSAASVNAIHPESDGNNDDT